MLRRLAILTAAVALAACEQAPSPSGAAAPVPAAPSTAPMPAAAPPAADGLATLPDTYRSKLERAFRSAEEGRDPTMACTSVIARAAGNPPADGSTPSPDAVRAYELCYIDVRARYLETILDAAAADATPDARDNACARVVSNVLISRSSLGTFAKNVGLELPALDRAFGERLRGRMESTCPGQLDAMAPSEPQ